MFGSNAHYGHRIVLNRYGGVPEGTPIPGIVQHGWNYDLGATLDDILLPAPEPFFIWSERNLRQCKKAGVEGRVVPIGSPFLYMRPIEEEIVPEPKSLLVTPIHGWERERIPHDFSAYADAIRLIAKDFRKIVACLYWHEVDNPVFRRPFEEIGAEITTVGHRDNNPGFLYDLRRLMLRFEYVTSNRAQTSLFYALALGRKAFLYGPPIGLDKRFDHSGQLFDAWQKQEYPGLFWDTFGDTCHRRIAEDELGLRYVREPAALRELFEWEPWQRGRIDERKARRRRALSRARWEQRLGGIKKTMGRIAPALFRSSEEEKVR
ncbi:hypothetical protein [Polyangium aurulentum]|uniref:hypothetical protein n=1 Tax=Polyangium aurulentum TaxID=2567896 RepID=UPI0010AE55F3|nr:hypothetical protein [Polyangium aurulentum]UQA58065.1 hypothetical protein E8A73_043520 [Polyangium aurulentum]